VDYLQEHDVEMAITINEDDKTWVRRTIARAGGSTATSTPWPQWLEYVRLWSVPTIAVALLIFTLNEWSKYIEFRTHTNDALQTIQDALHVVQISRAADTPTSPSSQAEAKAVIAQARKNPSRPLPIPIIEHAGTQFVNAAPSDPNAWNVALDFAAYRTSENRERSLGDYYPFDSKEQSSFGHQSIRHTLSSRQRTSGIYNLKSQSSGFAVCPTRTNRRTNETRRAGRSIFDPWRGRSN
jgi:hypothetical protein